jgi:hypothetical protein
MNTKVNQTSPQNIPTSNMYVLNGNIPPNMYTKGSQGQATDNAYNNGMNGTGSPVASSQEPRQLMSKTNYALPPTALTQSTGQHTQTSRGENRIGNHHRFSPVKSYSKPTGDEMSTEL